MKLYRVLPVLMLPLALGAQQSELQRRANDAWAARNWAVAAESYAALVRADSNVAQARFRLGAALVSLGRHGEARPQLQAAERLGSPVAQVAFYLALAHAADGAIDNAFQELKRSTDAGLSVAPVPLESNPDIARLRNDARYAQFTRDLDANARPCAYGEKYTEFDFWLGSWEVRPNGQPAAPPASNVITKILDGCVVLESWSAPGSKGQSFNIFDRTRGKWVQTWVDNKGGLHEYAGNLVDGNMVLEGEMSAPRPSTSRIRTRLTFSKRPDGSVRQFSERTVDGGKTWQVNYDLIYTKAAGSGGAR